MGINGNPKRDVNFPIGKGRPIGPKNFLWKRKGKDLFRKIYLIWWRLFLGLFNGGFPTPKEGKPFYIFRKPFPGFGLAGGLINLAPFLFFPKLGFLGKNFSFGNPFKGGKTFFNTFFPRGD